ADLALAALAIDVVLFLERLEAADAATDDHADAVRIEAGRVLEAGIRHRLCRRGNGVLREEIRALGFLPLEVHERIEMLDFTREANREGRRVELRDWPTPAPTPPRGFCAYRRLARR